MNSVNRQCKISINRIAVHAFLLALLTYLTILSPPTAFGVSPAPDGGYPNANTAEGTGALNSLNTNNGGGNTAIGDFALQALTAGSNNTAVGAEALFSNTGEFNTAVGASALQNNTSADFNTAVGDFALLSNTRGGGNTAIGASALQNNTTGSANTATVVSALANNTANGNTATGYQALTANTGGNSNMADGTSALARSTTGSGNTAQGNTALNKNTTGSTNTALGFLSGPNLTSGSNNLDIGANVPGVAGEANTIRIGKQGTQKSTFIAGIFGTPVTGSTVVVNSTGKLGVVSSSARFKEAIKPMDKASEAILELKPVSFRYKEAIDPDKVPQFGLIAEEVEKVSPDLVVRDENGKISTVRYEAVNAMLLNEFLKEHRTVESLKATAMKAESKAQQEEATVDELKRIVTQQQRQIETLSAGLQIISDEVKLREPMARLVNNDQ